MADRFNQIIIDLDALAHNLGRARRLATPGVRIMAVVKADAYGHGLVPAATRLVRAGADALGVMDLHEAAQIREAGLAVPLYVLAGITPDQCPELVARKVIPFIYEAGLAREMDQAARKRNQRAGMVLKIDTGMNRLGIPADQVEACLSDLFGLGNSRVTGLATHLAEADSPDPEFTKLQLRTLEKAIDLARAMGYDLSGNTAANSAGVLAHPAGHFQMVRPGLMLYGASPSPHLAERAGLKPVMTVTSQVIQVKDLDPGQAVSYGRTFRADRPMRVAAAPVGYAHGYNRLLSNRGDALIQGHRARILGRVCMNLTLFDVTDIPEAGPGDEVVLMGRQGDETITADELAGIAGTISYEVFCRFGQADRVYREGES